ncbi:VOC family protein [Chryseolinea soli]|uniref:VOC family protein n=1 Tax=Chryseolinea soli TaxID=2321403 RepID=A0A385SVC4_9BACT|nr:VOC family protein [Chryseolinea soli]AYB34107.1 VOC family protein [Chryseolinea soli]
MSNINDTLAKLEFAQIGWVVPDINATAKFLEKSLGIVFPKPERYSAEDLNIKYYGKVVPSDGLTTQTYNGSAFIELIQPLSGQSLFHDYLAKYPAGGVQHLAFRLPVSGFDRVVDDLTKQGYAIIGEVDHPIARMKFFDTYQTTGVATEIMGITPEGWTAIKSMEKAASGK